MIEIWTDGACDPNPGAGGWGWLASDGREHCGGEAGTTNNRMEMTAVLRALEAQADGAEVVVYSDSRYVVNGLTVWCTPWARRNWTRKGAPIPNRDLWLALEEQKGRLRARFKWVRGHAGNAGNERADRLAAAGREKALAATAPYAPKFDEAQFAKAVENGTKAWADIEDPVAWVREMRGSDE